MSYEAERRPAMRWGPITVSASGPSADGSMRVTIVHEESGHFAQLFVSNEGSISDPHRSKFNGPVEESLKMEDEERTREEPKENPALGF